MDARPDTAGRWRRRLGAAVVAGIVAGYVAYALSRTRRMDVGQVWYAARAILAGNDPYALIGPGRVFEWPAALFYPLTAPLALLPLAPLPERLAGSVFAALGAAALAWALTARERWPLLAFGSISVWHAIVTAQWSPLLAGAFAVPALGVVLACKPTIGAAVLAARPSWPPVIGGAVLVALAFLVQPAWVASWSAALGGTSLGGGKYPYLAPVVQLGGFIALMALLRWRRPEARLLVALACIPQTMLPYEGVLLFLIPRGKVECVAFLAANWLMGWWFLTMTPHPHYPTRYARYGLAMTVCMYLPATLMVLRRANEGTLPAWLERRTAVLPRWLRGAPE